MNAKVVAVSAVAVAVIGSIGAYTYFSDRSQRILLDEVLAGVSSINSYTQAVETQTIISDRQVSVIGMYRNNHSTNEYASFATTTISSPETGPMTFSINNIALGGRVYVQVQSDFEGLVTTVPADGVWRVYEFGAIPTAFQSVAIPGPVLDNLLLLSDRGSFLTLIKALGTDTQDGVELAKYRFKASGEKAPVASPLTTLLERIGTDGHIDVWVHEPSKTVRMLVITNPPYFSTTTFSGINNPPAIDTPQVPTR
jgi:hypothetical protein